MTVLALYLVLFFALVTTFAAIFFLRPLATRIGLLDVPNQRKQHQGAIPLIGGLSVFTGITVSLFAYQDINAASLTYLLCSTYIVMLGFLDDKYDLPAKARLVAQSFITLAMCLGSGLYLAHFGDLFGLGRVDLGLLGYLVTLMAVIGAINAFNMLDGIDGLVGSSALVSFTALAALFYRSHHESALVLALVFIVALIPYLATNLTIPPFRQKIFMGDAGSMLIGLTIVWLLLQGSQRSDIHSFRPVTALWLIAVPLMDMAAIMIRRVRKGHSPFQADRDHLHHIFMRAGYSTRQILLIITLASIILASIGLIGEALQIPDVVMFMSFLLLFILYSYALQNGWHLAKLVRKLK